MDLIHALQGPFVELRELVGAFRDLYAKLVGRRRFLWTLNPYIQAVGRAAATDTVCGYCAAPIDEYTHPWVDPRLVRTRGACRSCGTIYDLDPRLQARLEAPSRARAGSTVAVSVHVVSDYSFPVPSSGAAAPILVDGRPSRAAAFPLRDLEPGEAGELTTLVQIPAAAPAGRHRLAAAICAGPSIGYLTRYILVEPAEGTTT